MTQATSFNQTLEQFIKSDEFALAVLKSTQAGFGGSSYAVELFEDGTYRVLWAEQVGNRYDTPGAILHIPALIDNDYQDFVDMAGGSETDDLVAFLQGSDQLEEIAQEMRDSLYRR